jgi:hypothetical protein
MQFDDEFMTMMFRLHTNAEPPKAARGQYT